MSKSVLTVGSQSNIKNGLTTQLTYDVANAEKTSNQMWKWAFGNICMQTQGFQVNYLCLSFNLAEVMWSTTISSRVLDKTDTNIRNTIDENKLDIV